MIWRRMLKSVVEGHRNSVVDMNKIRNQVRVAERGERKVRVATWNFSGICSQRKQKEVAGVLVKNNIDVCAGQESWEKEESKISVDGYKWFGKPRQGSSGSKRGEGGVGFLVKECLASGVELIKDVNYEESMWIKVKGERGRKTLFLGCVYMPTDSENVSFIESSYSALKEDVLRMKERGQVVLLGDFNATVGKSSELDDVIGMFGEGKCNASGNRLISFLNEVELVVCNGREFTVEPQWTRARPSLKQKSIIDYIVTNSNLLQVSGSVQVDTVDIGKSDHFLVWMELGRTVKTTKQQKRVIKKWRIERFQDEEVRQKYQEALNVEVDGFQGRVRQWKTQGLRGSELVKVVVQDWEETVKRVASKEIGEKGDSVWQSGEVVGC